MESDDPEPDVNATSASGARAERRDPRRGRSGRARSGRARRSPDRVGRMARSRAGRPDRRRGRGGPGAAARVHPDVSPRNTSARCVLYNGIGILGMIGSPAAIPELVEVIRRYPEDSGELAAEVLGEFGPIAFEPALELVRDPADRRLSSPACDPGRAPRGRGRSGAAGPPRRGAPSHAGRCHGTRPSEEAQEGREDAGRRRVRGLGRGGPRRGGRSLRGRRGPRQGNRPRNHRKRKWRRESYIEGLNEIEAQPLEPDEEVMFLVERPGRHGRSGGAGADQDGVRRGSC